MLIQFMDDILRSGSRLVYEVELLRGEILNFLEMMNEIFKDDIKKFVFDGLLQELDVKVIDDGDKLKVDVMDILKDGILEDDLEYIKQLQILMLV